MKLIITLSSKELEGSFHLLHDEEKIAIENIEHLTSKLLDNEWVEGKEHLPIYIGNNFYDSNILGYAFNPDHDPITISFYDNNDTLIETSMLDFTQKRNNIRKLKSQEYLMRNGRLVEDVLNFEWVMSLIHGGKNGAVQFQINNENITNDTFDTKLLELFFKKYDDNLLESYVFERACYGDQDFEMIDSLSNTKQMYVEFIKTKTLTKGD